MTKTTVTGDRDSPGAGCRPCCSMPSGKYAILSAITATIALAFTWTAGRSCHFLAASFTYCLPPPELEPAYACCGECYCINGDEPCPDQVPNMNISQETLDMFYSLTPTNPYNLTCNPYDTQYNGIPCETTPSQNYTELGDTAVCGVLYDMSALDANQCPIQYTLQSYPDLESAMAAGAVVTHWGACGVCSTTQDLGVYIEFTDLTTLGVECSVQAGLRSFEEGVRCYQRAGYTRPCAEMWVYNARQTSDYCGKTCLGFRTQGRPNNGPAPECTLDECLDCDETNSGPLFAKIAARTRRLSGLLSKIARSCSDILFVDHRNPCDVVRGTSGQIREFVKGNDVCELREAAADPDCVTVSTDMGLSSYEAPSNGKLFDFGILSGDDGIYTTVYGKCKRYSTRRAQDGFWYHVKDNVLGSPWKAARICSIMATIIGTLLWLFIWIAACVAFPKNFWLACAALFVLVGVFMFCTLAFIASDVCLEGGCTLLSAAYCAIIAGVLWLVTAGLCWKTALQDRANAYTPVSFDVFITEYVQPDGSILTEKVTTRSNGTSVIERTTFVRKDVESDTGSVHVGVRQSSAIATGVVESTMKAQETEHETVSIVNSSGGSSDSVNSSIKKEK